MTFVQVTEVGARDGLQNESTVLDPQTRAELVRRLAGTGVPRVEAVSFVHPKLVPAMAGAEEIMTDLGSLRGLGVLLSGLVLNRKGFDRAVAAGVDVVNYSFPVSDGFAARNQNTTVADGVAASHDIVAAAREADLPVVVTLSTSFGCPFDGAVPVAQTLAVAEQVMQVAPDEICLGDTIGVGVPSQVRELTAGLLAMDATPAMHFHNTRGTGIANALAAVDAGVTRLDASVGGTGGCPFAPKATGNIATEDLAYLLAGMGVDTGIDLDAVIGANQWLAERLGRELPAMVAKAGVPEWFPSH
jgi:isopropylmalate/homocitrate/citramalate synthase